MPTDMHILECPVCSKGGVCWMIPQYKRKAVQPTEIDKLYSKPLKVPNSMPYIQSRGKRGKRHAKKHNDK